MSFYEVFVLWCTSIGEKPTPVAVGMGFSKSTVTNWKKRKNVPQDSTFQTVLDFFGVSKEQFWKGPKSKEPTDQKDSGLHVETAYDLLTPQNKEKIRIQIVSLLKQQSDS